MNAKTSNHSTRGSKASGLPFAYEVFLLTRRSLVTILRTPEALLPLIAISISFPLTFLAPTFVPLDLLSGWLATAARVNPITYVLEAMRTLITSGWDTTALWQGVLACLVLAAVTYVLAAVALRVRTRRS